MAVKWIKSLTLTYKDTKRLTWYAIANCIMYQEVHALSIEESGVFFPLNSRVAGKPFHLQTWYLDLVSTAISAFLDSSSNWDEFENYKSHLVRCAWI